MLVFEVLEAEETLLKKGEIMLFLNDEGQLMPVDGESAKRYTKMYRGVAYRFTIKRERNYEFHKKYFALLNCVYKSQDRFSNFEWFRKYTCIAIGWCNTYTHPVTGDVWNEPKSISFEKCKENEFNDIYRCTLSYFFTEYGLDESTISRLLSFS